MRRDFANRDELQKYLAAEFPLVPRPNLLSDIPGGRKAALEALSRYHPVGYAESRNYLDGNVTHLSAWLRHGVLSLHEVRRALLRKVSHPSRMFKLLQELAWRDYWRRVWLEDGDRVWRDREPSKTGNTTVLEALPADVASATTGLVCIDHFITTLYGTGYLHNHARMWLAAYLLHWRQVRWQTGARWFLQHLVDGDIASNNYSWQWVASTFSAKPYFFNRENLEKYSRGVYCNACPKRGHCDFEGDHAQVSARLFPLMENRL